MEVKEAKTKNPGEVVKEDFWLYYKEHAKEGREIKLKTKNKDGSFKTKTKILSRTQYLRFITEVLKTYSTAIVQDAFELRFRHLGSFRIRAKALDVLKDGKLHKGLKPNWPATWEYWNAKYKGLTREEILAIPNKTVIKFTNDHTHGEFYYHYWCKIDCGILHKPLYKFQPPRQFSRMIAKLVKDPNRKVFYYA